MNRWDATGSDARDRAKALNIIHGNLYETEWQGTVISVTKASKRYTLSIDGITQDFYESYITPEGVFLKGQNHNGDRIEIKAVSVFIFSLKFEFYFNGKYIYSADVHQS